MPPRNTIRVSGLREFQRALKQADKDTRKVVRDELKEAGESVRDEWDRRFSVVDAFSASKYRVRVRQAGVFVQQALRKSSDLKARRKNYPAMQMRTGLRVLEDKRQEVERNFERAIDKVADRLEGR